MFWKNETPLDLTELAETYQRKKRQLADLQKELKEIEALVEAAGLSHLGTPEVDDKWELPPFKILFYSRVDIKQARAVEFLERRPEYWSCFEQKLSARKQKLLKEYTGAPPKLKEELNEVFELVACKPRFSVKEEKEL